MTLDVSILKACARVLLLQFLIWVLKEIFCVCRFSFPSVAILCHDTISFQQIYHLRIWWVHPLWDEAMQMQCRCQVWREKALLSAVGCAVPGQAELCSRETTAILWRAGACEQVGGGRTITDCAMLSFVTNQREWEFPRKWIVKTKTFLNYWTNVKGTCI